MYLFILMRKMQFTILTDENLLVSTHVILALFFMYQNYYKFEVFDSYIIIILYGLQSTKTKIKSVVAYHITRCS